MGRPDLTPSQQYLHLCRNPICAGEGALSPTGLVWRYTVRPSPLSREYLVRIEARRDGVPRVFIERPNLFELTEERDPPHIYHNPVRLCLFLPGSGEWLGYMRIDQTFVPWTATWLYYFEEWLDSGDWKSGGEHPDPGEAETYNRRTRRRFR